MTSRSRSGSVKSKEQLQAMLAKASSRSSISSISSSSSSKARRNKDGSAQFAAKLEKKLLQALAGEVTPRAYAELVDFVRERVAGVVSRGIARITDADLTALEQAAQQCAARLRAAHARDFEAEVAAGASESKHGGGEGKESKEGDSGLPRDDYLTLIGYDRVTHALGEKAERARVRAEQRVTKLALDEQLALKAERKAAEVHAEKAFGDQVYADARAYEREKEEKRRRALEAFKEDKRLREAQLQQRREAEQRRENRRTREEAEELSRIHASLQQEAQRKRDNVVAQQELYAAFSRDLEVQKTKRGEAKQALWEEDVRRSQAYAEKLATEEANRAEALQRLKAKASNNQQMYLEATASDRVKAEEDAERSVRALAAEQQRASEKAAALAENRRLRLLDASQVNQGLIERREEAERLRRQDFHDSAVVARREADEHEAGKLAARLSQRRKAAELCKALDAQVKRKHANDMHAPTKMNLHEQEMNADRFRRVDEDPAVHARVKAGFKKHPKHIAAHAKLQRKQQAKIRSSYH